eukprot:gnl/TRDRNA2_/TRDRNA2_176080_c0_seq1.p1 gnl/TRDRNA2_/TRDRNA2_176080_c0~~gnl/TRDRNA2_/TRDRNA2_176080_c0_seq1.p1  ORF type:complete len:303 (-),score=52.05 gnl/TRDRNA2_/TRDRNA2_176080_c0_seq1:531-1439(-)
MSPMMWILIISALVLRVDADAHSGDCMTVVMTMPEVKTADGKLCFPSSRRLADLAKSPWRRLDGHEAIMDTMCEPACFDSITQMVEKCEGVDGMEETVGGLKMLVPLCSDACMMGLMKMDADPPKTAGGKVCFPDRRRLSELTTPVSPWRRLGGHAGIMESICEPECTEAANAMFEVCDSTTIPELADTVEMVKSIVPMCKDDCLKAILWMDPKGCDGGEDSEKVCDFTGECKDLACDIKANCEIGKPPVGMGGAEWEEGLGKFLETEGTCSLCGAATTSSVTQTTLTGFAVALLFAAFALQ